MVISQDQLEPPAIKASSSWASGLVNQLVSLLNRIKMKIVVILLTVVSGSLLMFAFLALENGINRGCEQKDQIHTLRSAAEFIRKYNQDSKDPKIRLLKETAVCKRVEVEEIFYLTIMLVNSNCSKPMEDISQCYEDRSFPDMKTCQDVIAVVKPYREDEFRYSIKSLGTCIARDHTLGRPTHSYNLSATIQLNHLAILFVFIKIFNYFV